MRTKRYWDNRYKDFINILDEEIDNYKAVSICVKEEMEYYEQFFKKQINEKNHNYEELVIFLVINHELNLLDPIGCCYPSVINEYSSYAWRMLDRLLENRDMFPQNLKKELMNMWESVASNPYKDKQIINRATKKISNNIKQLYSGLEFVKGIHAELFSEDFYWKKQFDKFQYHVLGQVRKESLGKMVLIQEERDHLIENEEINRGKNYEDYIQFLYINHHLNLLDPTNMHYPIIHYYYEPYAWRILKLYQGSDDKKRFQEQVKSIFYDIYRGEGIDSSRDTDKIAFRIRKMNEQLNTMNK